MIKYPKYEPLQLEGKIFYVSYDVFKDENGKYYTWDYYPNQIILWGINLTMKYPVAVFRLKNIK